MFGDVEYDDVGCIGAGIDPLYAFHTNAQADAYVDFFPPQHIKQVQTIVDVNVNVNVRVILICGALRGAFG